MGQNKVYKHGRVVFGVGKAVLFGEVSSFHGSAIEGFHCMSALH